MTGFKTRCWNAIAILLVATSIASPLRAQNRSISGTVRGRTGQAVSGAIVRIASDDTGLTLAVVSQAQGRFRTPPLPPGRYTVQGFGGNDQSEVSNPVEIGAAPPGAVEVKLTAARKPPSPPKKMSDSDYVKLMPPGDARNIIVMRCTLCHGLERIVPTRHTPEAWKKTIDRMSGFIAERADLQKRLNRGPLSNEDRALLTEYVTKNFGNSVPRPDELKPETIDPDENLPRRLLSGAEANYVAMEFDPRSGGRTGGKERGTLLDIEYEFGVDNGGTTWLSGVDNALFGHIDAKSLAFTRIELPPGKKPRALAQIGIDPEQNVWILDNGTTPDSELLKFDPKTRDVKTFVIPAPPTFRAPLNTLRFVDGNVWGTGNSSSRVIMLDPRTGKIDDYHVPGGSHPYGLTIGVNQSIWYTGMYDNEVVHLEPGSGKRTPYKIATARAAIRRIDSDADGNIWVAAQDSGRLYKLDTLTGKFSEYIPPTPDPGVYGIAVDKERNLVWFTERDGDRVGRFDPKSGKFVEFPLPTSDVSSRRVIVDPSNPNRVWWGGKRIGYVEALQ